MKLYFTHPRMEGNTTYLFATQRRAPTLCHSECHQKQEFSNSKQIIVKEVLHTSPVTKANYVVKPCDFQRAIYHKAYLGTLEASLSQWLVWNVVQRELRLCEYILFHNKVSGGKGGSKQLLPSHKTKQLQTMNINTNNKKLVIPSSLVFTRMEDKIF